MYKVKGGLISEPAPCDWFARSVHESFSTTGGLVSVSVIIATAVQADPEPQRLVSSYRLGYSQVSGLAIDGNVLKATALKQIRLPGGLGLSSLLQGMFCKHRQSERICRRRCKVPFPEHPPVR